MKFSKGQYTVVSEILLFLIGILITSYVIISFSDVQNTVKRVTLQDHLESVADLVSTAIVMVANANNATIRVDLPDKISENFYWISLSNDQGGKLTITTIDGSIFVERKIFNIDYDNTVNNMVINSSSVLSSAQFIEIVKNEKITIVRG